MFEKGFMIKANKIRDNETYEVYDYPMIGLNLSLTILHGKKKTTGHKHEDSDEVYFFVTPAILILDGHEYEMEAGDFETIPRGVHHQVVNESDRDCKFYCVFEKYRGRGK